MSSVTSIRILVVDDFEPFRQFIVTLLQTVPDLQILCAVSDGFEAVQKAEKLRPDVILLEIGLPGQNGIEAARQMRKVSPESKIIFVSQESSEDVVQEAFRLGALGYVAKTNAASDLLRAVQIVSCNEPFISSTLVRSATATLRSPVRRRAERQ